MTAQEAVDYLRISVTAVRLACQREELEHIRPTPRTIRIRKDWIDKWADKVKAGI